VFRTVYGITICSQVAVRDSGHEYPVATKRNPPGRV